MRTGYFVLRSGYVNPGRQTNLLRHPRIEDLRQILNPPSSSTMPPPFEHKAFYLALLPNTYFVKQLPSTAELPENTLSLLNEPGFFSITRTPEEISIVGEISNNPQIRSLGGGFGDWRCIKVAGPMEFGKPPHRVRDKIMFRAS